MRNAIVILAICLPPVAGCKHRTPPSPVTPVSTTAPSRKFAHEKSGVELTWLDGWRQVPSEQFELMIVPQSAKDDSQWIALKVPELPVHIPAMVPIRRVESGYLDDLRKQAGTIEVTELDPPAVAETKARFVRAAWSDSGKRVQQTALLLVHADQVYILRARSNVEQEQETLACLDAIIKSLRWAAPAPSANR